MIGQLQNSVLALDVYGWRAHYLWRVKEGQGIDLSWAALKAQFGQEYATRRTSSGSSLAPSAEGGDIPTRKRGLKRYRGG